MVFFSRTRNEHERRIEQCADDLIALYGKDAWGIVYERCREMNPDSATRKFNLRVRRILERKLGIPPRVDTATRYLEQD